MNAFAEHSSLGHDIRPHHNHSMTMMDVAELPTPGTKHHGTRRSNKRHQLEAQLHGSYGAAPGGHRVQSTPHAYVFNDHLSKSNQDAYPGVFGLTMPIADVQSQATFSRLSARAFTEFASFTIAERHQFFYQYTNPGFREAMRVAKTLNGPTLTLIDGDKYIDTYGIVRDKDGPFWPMDYGPMFPAPAHRCHGEPPRHESLKTDKDEGKLTIIKFSPYLTEVSSLVRGLLSLAGNTWLQCCFLGQLSMYLLAGYGIFCLLSFLLLVVVVMCYAL